MSGYIAFQPSEFYNAASRIQSRAQEIALILQEVRMVILSLNVVGRGQEAKIFDELMAEFTKDSQAIEKVLDEISKHLLQVGYISENAASGLRSFVLEAERPISTEKQLSSDESRGPSKGNLKSTPKGVPTLSIRIIEELLTPYNLTIILSAPTELSTKLWLITKSRFADLIEYTQTHDARFTEEAGLVITRVTYNSPFNMDWKVDLSATGVADAIVTAIDGIGQRKGRLEKSKLENQEKAQQIEQAKQKAGLENQMAVLEQKEQELKIEEQRLALLERELEIQKKAIDYALEIAKKTVDMLQPNADDVTKAMLIQTLLPNILQIQSNKAMVLALPVPQNNPEQPAKPEDEKKS